MCDFVSILPSAQNDFDVCRFRAVMAAQDAISTELRAAFFVRDIFRASRSAWMLSVRTFVRIASYYLLIHAPFTRIVVFWHSGNVPPMISVLLLY